MALNLEQKKAIVAEVAAVANDAISAISADYRGMTVSELTQLRNQARENGVYLRVVRNTLAKRAVENTEFECMADTFVGPLLIGFAQHEPSAAARLFKDFAKTNDNLNVTALAIGGQVFDAKDIDRVAKLPTRDEALSRLMATMQGPISKFVRTMAEPHGKLVRTIAAVRDKKQAES